MYVDYQNMDKSVAGFYFAELFGRFVAELQKNHAPNWSKYSLDFTPCEFFFVSKLEEVIRRPEILVEWGGYRRHGGLGWIFDGSPSQLVDQLTILFKIVCYEVEYKYCYKFDTISLHSTVNLLQVTGNHI